MTSDDKTQPYLQLLAYVIKHEECEVSIMNSW
jgi:hypothetical protein